MAAITGKPAYQQIVEDLKQRIESGTLPAGSQLPSTAQMTETYGVSTTVVRAAVNQLRLEGFVIGQPGKGVYVRDIGEQRPLAGSSDYVEIMQQLRGMRAELAAMNDRLSRLEEMTVEQPPERP
jgi:GntR family transcriptional regulator